MRYYRAKPGTEISGNDQAGNVWPEALTFGADGLLEVPDDQQDVITALESAVGAGAVSRTQAPAQQKRSK